MIFASLVLTGILITQFNQMPSLDKQLGQAKADLKQAKLSHKKSETIVSSPQSQQSTVSDSTNQVTNFVKTFSNQPTSTGSGAKLKLSVDQSDCF